jgi:UDPglucose 6-dehydrogenase
MGETAGISTPLLSAVQQVNETARTRTVRRIRDELGGLDGRHVAVWGLTFKGETEDVRQSPSVEVVQLLVHEGATVTAYDPSRPTAAMLPARLDLTLVETALGAVSDADALLILTDWHEFRDVPLDVVAMRMRGDVVLDGRNLLRRGDVERSGLRYLGVGRGRTTRQRNRTEVLA